MRVEGECDPRFRGVRDAFERNFAERGEVGASVCVTVAGDVVVDLWGGLAERDPARPWGRDTLVVVWSSSKGAAAVAAHVLVSRGQLDLDLPVAALWPEFAANGKDHITTRLLLDHQAGLPAFRAPLRPGGLYDWDYLTARLAGESPFWPPGTRQGYHAATFGHLVGEVVRRAAGRPFGEFFRTDIAGPLGLDLHFGLPAADDPRVAPTIRPDITPAGETPSRFIQAMSSDPTSLQSLVTRNTGRRPSARDHDSPEAHQAVLPSQGATGNARSLAFLYRPLALGGSFGSCRLVDRATAARMSAVSSATAVDATLLVGMRFGLGFMKSVDNRRAAPGARESLIMSEAAFGHAGMGGSLGFADPESQVSFGYTMNKQGRGTLLNERGQSLVNEVYRALGHTFDERGGVWRNG